MKRRCRLEKNCLNCDKLILVLPSIFEKGGGKYCSNSCKNKFNWAKPEYRTHMSEAHKGQVPTNLKELIAYSKSTEGRRTNSEKNMGKKAWNKGMGNNQYTSVGKYGWEHRKVMEQTIRRKLLKREVVHHWDEDKKNNSPENLCLMRKTAPHIRLHAFVRRHGLKMESLKFHQSWLVEVTP